MFSDNIKKSRFRYCWLGQRKIFVPIVINNSLYGVLFCGEWQRKCNKEDEAYIKTKALTISTTIFMYFHVILPFWVSYSLNSNLINVVFFRIITSNDTYLISTWKSWYYQSDCLYQWGDRIRSLFLHITLITWKK